MHHVAPSSVPEMKSNKLQLRLVTIINFHHLHFEKYKTTFLHMKHVIYLLLISISATYLCSSPSSSFLYVEISMSKANLTFMSSWYSLTCRAMSCLALCRASSRSLMRSLASCTASSPRCSASAIWLSAEEH